MRYSFFKVLLLFYSFSFSQTKISGGINDLLSKKLSGANITVSKINEEVIITYAISNNDGEYSLNINSKLDSLQINVSYIGYAKQTKIVANKNQTLNFKLLESSEKLKKVLPFLRHCC